MKLLFISKTGESLSIAERVQQEGHSSTFLIVDRKMQRVGQRIVDRTNFDPHIINSSGHAIQSSINQLLHHSSPDLVVFDSVGLGRVADSIRKTGLPVLGACRWADEAELDATYGYKLMKQVGINTYPLNERDECVEVRCELWWNGLSSYIHNIIYNEDKFMNEGIGPRVESAGSIVKMVSSKSMIVKQGVGRMERLLKKTTYRGPISVDMIATKDGLYGTGLTVGFGYNTLQLLLELHKGSITELLYNVASSTNGCGEFTGDSSISVRMSIPPYPHLDKTKQGILIGGVNVNNQKHIWWGSVMKDEGGDYVSAGTSGVIAAVTARGRDITECRRRVYRTVNNISIEDSQYRTDIGLRVNRDEKRLKSWGYL